VRILFVSNLYPPHDLGGWSRTATKWWNTCGRAGTPATCLPAATVRRMGVVRTGRHADVVPAGLIFATTVRWLLPAAAMAGAGQSARVARRAGCFSAGCDLYLGGVEPLAQCGLLG